MGRLRRKPLLCLIGLRRCLAGNSRFRIDDQRSRRDRQTRSYSGARRWQYQVRPFSQGDARGGYHEAFLRPNRVVVLPDTRRHGACWCCTASTRSRTARARMTTRAVYLGMVLFALILLFLLPQIDLMTSGVFYDPGRGFAPAGWQPVMLLSQAIPWIAWGALVFVLIGIFWLLLVGRPLWRFNPRALVFLVASIAVGPGLLANTLLKDHWGRARPTQIEAFGGAHHFTPAPLPAAECDRNCAFVSGHAALAFSLVSLAFLFPPGHSRRRGLTAALGFGALVGMGRIAQGAHFLSDVVYAGLLAYGTTALLYWLIVDCDGLAAPPVLRFYRLILRGAVAAWTVAHRALGSTAIRLVFVAATALLVVIS